jgi:hypothetical protein
MVLSLITVQYSTVQYSTVRYVNGKSTDPNEFFLIFGEQNCCYGYELSVQIGNYAILITG